MCSQLAKKLNAILESLNRPLLDALIQINTSGEDSKNGVEPAKAIELAQFVHQECPRLRFAGKSPVLGCLVEGLYQGS